MTRYIMVLVAALILPQLTLPPSLLAAGIIPSPTGKDKCPVCGMFVGSYQNWLTVIRLKNGRIAYFDGPKDMFTYYLKPDKYVPSLTQSAINEIWVKDYYSMKPIEARKAYFVAGSDVMGPMGKELVPMAKSSDTQEFMADHKGKKIYRFSEITPAVLKSLE
ncbi:nosL protein [Geobacter sp. OR-1]|uniref:nitrous oxide reductase accessory protein NosL n=1 Tax=Geobacter sp. OR-1 TaxID=1266765 RepID=UPI00054237F5|nr:nitrous oxide reductase accessory protein NosL [Geobacter sp. OR-1]GAM10072.1 nosL protein [Geobacter sp. OR-1]